MHVESQLCDSRRIRNTRCFPLRFSLRLIVQRDISGNNQWERNTSDFDEHSRRSGRSACSFREIFLSFSCVRTRRDLCIRGRKCVVDERGTHWQVQTYDSNVKVAKTASRSEESPVASSYIHVSFVRCSIFRTREIRRSIRFQSRSFLQTVVVRDFNANVSWQARASFKGERHCKRIKKKGKENRYFFFYIQDACFEKFVKLQKMLNWAASMRIAAQVSNVRGR